MPRTLRILLICCGLLAVVRSSPTPAAAQSDDPRVGNLDNRLTALERRIESYEDKAAGAGLALFGIASLCALWAQNSRRSGWLWFFLGLFFSVITLLVMLYKNAADRDRGAVDEMP